MALDAIRCSCSGSLQSIFPSLRDAGLAATLLDPNSVFSPDHLFLAEALARKSTADKTAVSSRIEMEFLLWLAHTPHADKAIARVGAKKSEDFILVLLGNGGHGALAPDAKTLAKKLGLTPSPKPIARNEAALSFFGVKTPEQLYEKMALSRI